MKYSFQGGEGGEWKQIHSMHDYYNTVGNRYTYIQVEFKKPA